MPTLTDSVLNLRQDAPPHDYLLVADETMDLSNVTSDAVHMADQTSSEILLYYRNAMVKITPQSSFAGVISELNGKMQYPPDKDPSASDFPTQ